MKATAVVLLWVLGLGAGAAAQEQPAARRAPSEQAPSDQAPAPEETSLALPTKDLFDLVRELAPQAAASPAGARRLQEVDGRRRAGRHLQPDQRVRDRRRGKPGRLPGLSRHDPDLLDRRQRDGHDQEPGARQREDQRHHAGQPQELRERQPPVLDVAEDLRPRHRHGGGRRGRPEVRLLPVLRDHVLAGRAQHLPRRGLPLQQPPERPPGGRSGGGGVGRLAVRHVLRAERVRPGIADLGRRSA